MKHIENIPQKILMVILPILVCVFIVYGFLLRQTILNVVARENIGKNMSTILSMTSSLEAKYIGIKDGIDLNLAYSRGFEDAASPLFVTRSAPGLAYGIR